jgi:hypothetical protein
MRILQMDPLGDLFTVPVRPPLARTQASLLRCFARSGPTCEVGETSEKCPSKQRHKNLTRFEDTPGSFKLLRNIGAISKISEKPKRVGRPSFAMCLAPGQMRLTRPRSRGLRSLRTPLRRQRERSIFNLDQHRRRLHRSGLVGLLAGNDEPSHPDLSV